MNVFWIGAFAGSLTGVVTACVTWFALANRSDRGLSTGPLPVLPQPPPPWADPPGERTQPLPYLDLAETGHHPHPHRAHRRPLAPTER